MSSNSIKKDSDKVATNIQIDLLGTNCSLKKFPRDKVKRGMVHEEQYVSDDDCIDAMCHILREDYLLKEFRPNRLTGRGADKDKISIKDNLLSDDFDLLEKYAPKLFNTFDEPNELEKVMTLLIAQVNSYRHCIKFNKKQREEYEKEQIISKKKSLEYKIKIFQDDIQKIINTIVDKNYINPYDQELADRKNNLLKELKLALTCPKIYIHSIDDKSSNCTINDEPVCDKKAIMGYLKMLNLPNKSTIIEEFYKKII
ncbi:MAG: hypothetical protein U9N59_00955 [Campylobacterota bacterium]|nr:hypothetical protein [Campylobacterota bacterium]